MNIREYWPEPNFIEECIPVQAERLSPGTLWAVHEPMELLYRSTEGRSHRRTDKEFLSELIQNTDGPIPVLGSPGSGKSHLVRWVDSALRRVTDSERFHIVRIKKNASLRSALESILEGLDTKEFEATKREVALLQQDQTPLTVAEQLVFHMGQQVGLFCQKEIDNLKQAVSERSTPPTEEERQSITFYRLHGNPDRGLKHLIMDPHFQSKFLKENTPLFKYASRLVGGSDGTGIDDDEIYDFTDSFELGHFGFDNLDDHRLSEPARDYLNNSHIHKDREEASEVVSLLSKSLGIAVKAYFEDAFRYSGGSFQDLFRDIRRYLKQINKELFVLVEDLAAIKAISETLIDCLLEDPDETLTPVHSVIASTSGALGYQTTKDTILSRSGGEWVVDVDEQSVTEDELISRTTEMVGRYLNASRIGRDKLDEALKTGSNNVPIFSVDLDTAVWDCSEAGYCLFPHTRTSIKELAKVYLENRNLLTFSPRKVLQKILRPVLRHRPWVEGGFPNRESLAGITLNTDLVNEAQMRVNSNPVQTALFARIWGGNPTSLGGARNQLSNEVCEALGFDELLSIPPVTPSGGDIVDPEVIVDKPKKSGTNEIGLKEFELVDVWLDGKAQLDSRVARIIRQFISESFIARSIPGLDFNSDSFKVDTNDVVIPKAIGNPKTGGTLKFFEDKDFAANLDLMASVSKAIVRFSLWKSSSREPYPQLTADLSVIENYLEGWFYSAFETFSQEQTKLTLGTAKRVAKSFILQGKIKQSVRKSEEKLDSFIQVVRDNPSSPDRSKTLQHLHPAIARAERVTSKSVSEVKTFFFNSESTSTGIMPVSKLKKSIRDAEKELSQDDVVVQTFVDAGRDLYLYAPIINNFEHATDDTAFKEAISSLKRLLEHASRIGRSLDLPALVDLTLLRNASNKYLTDEVSRQQLSNLVSASKAQNDKGLNYFRHALLLDKDALEEFLVFVNEWTKLVNILDANTEGTGSTLENDMIHAIAETDALAETLRSISNQLDGDTA